jgi:NAD(P)-dependent dehydrogenase (short-subunit alcohol dehydrogenase family)
MQNQVALVTGGASEHTMREFKGKNAVITGGASGIGLGIASRCVEEGMNVMLADINEADLRLAVEGLNNRGVMVFGMRTDVSKRADVQALADRTLETFGGVHLLVNNAGVGAGTSPWESTWNDWEWVIGVDLWGVINGVKIFTPIMVSQNTECHIVNTSSMAGMAAYMHSAPYQVAKHAVVALSENLSVALEMQKALVKVSVLCPGFVRTRTMESERNRPIELRDEPREISFEQQAMLRAAREAVEAGMSPDELASHVFRALREERFYILTHPEEIPSIRERMENILNGRNPRNPSGTMTVPRGE